MTIVVLTSGPPKNAAGPWCFIFFPIQKISFFSPLSQIFICLFFFSNTTRTVGFCFGAFFFLESKF